MSLRKWLNDHNSAVSALGVTLLVVVLFAQDTWFGQSTPFYRMEAAMRDLIAAYGRPADKDPALVFLADDAASHTLDQLWEDEIAASPTLALMKKRAWSRQVWADVLDRLAAAGARVVAFDYMFKGEDDGDAALKDAVERHKHIVVLGSHIDDAKVSNQAMPTIQPPEKTILGEAADPRVGFVNVFPEPDGVVRRMRFRTTREQLAKSMVVPSDAIEYESFAARIVRQAGLAERIPPGRDPHAIRYAYKGETLNEQSKPISLYSLFVPAMWESNYQNGEFFRGKIVIVGPEGNYTKDVGLSPFGLIAGPEFHLNATNALLHGAFLKETNTAVRFLLIGLAGLFAWLMLHLIHDSRLRAAIIIPLAFAFFTLGVLAYNASWVIPVVSPFAAVAGTVFVATAWQQIIERMEKTRLRKTFERYVSRDVVKELLDNPSSYLNTVGGARRNVTVLFSDVRGFTTITESGDPQALVAQLNEYFDHMVNIVFDHRGTLDKFIGDAVMAQWGGIVSAGEKQDAINAVRTAVQMRKRLAKLNADWNRRGMLELRFGIGINQGEAIVGNLGCDAKMEVSLIGDAVNTASRFEGMTKEFHLDLLIGENVERFVRDQFILRTVVLALPKGKTKPIQIFTVIDECGPGVTAPAWLDAYEKAVQIYRDRHFTEAATIFEEVSRQIPEDWLCGEYIRWCRMYEATPPPADWNGIFVMTRK